MDDRGGAGSGRAGAGGVSCGAVTAGDMAVFDAVNRAIAVEARRLCREGCKDDPGAPHCRACSAGRHPEWRRDAIASLRAKAALRRAQEAGEAA